MAFTQKMAIESVGEPHPHLKGSLQIGNEEKMGYTGHRAFSNITCLPSPQNVTTDIFSRMRYFWSDGNKGGKFC